jgi:hypothetical protein
VAGSDAQRAVGLEQFAGEGDQSELGAGRFRQLHGMGELLHEPGPAEEPLGQHGVAWFGLDEAVGPAEHARPPFQIEEPVGVRRSPVVQPQKSHPAREVVRLGLQVFEHLGAGREDDLLDRRAQGDFHQRGRLDADVQQIGHQAQDLGKRPFGGVLGLGKDFLDPGAEPFLALLEVFEDRYALGRSTVASAQFRQVVARTGELPFGLFEPRLGGGKLLLALVHPAREVLSLPVVLLQLLVEPVELRVQFAEALPALGLCGGGRFDLTLQGTDLVAYRGDRADLVQVGVFPLFVFLADLVEPADQLGQLAFFLDEASGDLLMVGFGCFDGLGGLVQLLLEIAGPGAHLGEPATIPGDLLFEVPTPASLVFERRLVSGDPLAVGGNPCLGRPDVLVDVAHAGFGVQQACLDKLGLGDLGVPLSAERGQFGLEFLEPIGQASPIDQAYLGAEFLEPVGVFRISPGLAGLHPHAAEPGFDLVDNVGQTQQVLFDPIEPPQRFEFLGLEEANAGRLLEDDPPVPGRGLQEDVHLALLDDAVGLGSHAGAAEQVADVAQPARLAVDEVFPLAAAVDAACDVDLGGVDREQMVGIVEREGDFGRIRRPARPRAVEDHIGHFLAAEALDALLAQDPLDGVDDVRFARPVRPHNDRNSGGELEEGLVGKTLEADDFQGFEHEEDTCVYKAATSGRGRSVPGAHRLAGGLARRCTGNTVSLVTTLCVLGPAQPVMLREVPLRPCRARPEVRSHAERGNESIVVLLRTTFHYSIKERPM